MNNTFIKNNSIKSLFVLIIALVCSQTHAQYNVISTAKGGFTVLDENKQALLRINSLSFKPKWQWMSLEALGITDSDEGSLYQYSMDQEHIAWDLLFSSNKKSLSINSTLTSTKTIPLTYISLEFAPDKALTKGRILLTDIHGKTSRSTLPLKIKNSTNIQSVSFFNAQGDKKLHLTFSQAVNIHQDRNLRVKLINNEIKTGVQYQQKITLSAPKDIHFYSQASKIPAQTDHKQWFAFNPSDSQKTSSLSMSQWLKSASKHTKIWGTNVEYIHVAPTQRNAKQRTRFFSKYGINGVRLHKLTNYGWEGLGNNSSASEYDPKKMARFDYWLYELNKANINYGFSPIWDLMVFEGDREKLLAYDEIVKASPRKPVTSELVWFANDVQDLHIETITNLLNHKNPHTGLRYADDPKLNYIEIQNESNIFFYTFIPTVRKHPTYHKLLAEQFSDWLIQKYHSHNNLVSAWGSSAIDTFKKEGGLLNEQLTARNITPVISPWLYDNQATRGYRAKRLQDTAEFLFLKQQQYYTRATKAIRATGFKGLIVNSNWQAGSKGAHFLNLLSDSTSGVIDRHNYQGGAKGNPSYTMKSGFETNNYTMLGDPGSGLLSVGMQQVKDLPFMYSEWLSVVPSEWAAADTSIVAIYGFGLQGWDMSYHFASNGDRFSPELAYPSGKKFNNLTPLGVGLYPVLSRMVLRGDITEANPIATRRLSKNQALTNRYDFDNSVLQKHDVKSFSGTPHHNALAAGKVLIEFTKKDSRSDITHWKAKHLNNNHDGSKTIHSSTKELSWTYREGTQKGFIEVNSKGTQGLIGFTSDKEYTLNDINITPQSPYSVILTTAKSPNNTLATDKEAIIVAIARVHNTDMKIVGSLIGDAGKAPMIIEPVKAKMHFKRNATIHVLDHDGVPTGKTYPLVNGIFHLDTQRDKTIYYLVRFAE